MSNTTSSIITIGREYGSGGRQIGQEVAKYFGIKCYDKELLERAANDSGICKELFEHHDEKPTNSFLYSLVMDTYSFGYSSAGFNDMPMNHKIFLAQFDAIKKLAEEGPCVMVGPLCGLCAFRLARLLQHFHSCRHGCQDPQNCFKIRKIRQRGKGYYYKNRQEQSQLL